MMSGEDAEPPHQQEATRARDSGSRLVLCEEATISRRADGGVGHPTLRADAASLGSAAVVEIDRAFEQAASRRAAL